MVKSKEKTVEGYLYEMLTENTGTHMLDSGGAYGRNWQRNKDTTIETWENADAVTSEIYSDEVTYTINVYHYLKNQLDVDEICHKFNDMIAKADNWDYDDYYGVSDIQGTFLELIGFEKGYTENTYNHESNLSQILQYSTLTLDDEYYILIQIHGGCDARGGYTDAKLFKLDNGYDYDSGYLVPENVYGTVTTDDVEYLVSNTYDGWSLTIDNDNCNGEPVPVNENSIVVLDGYFSE